MRLSKGTRVLLARLASGPGPHFAKDLQFLPKQRWGAVWPRLGAFEDRRWVVGRWIDTGKGYRRRGYQITLAGLIEAEEQGLT